MAKKKTGKINAAEAPAVMLNKPKPKKPSSKVKGGRLDNEKLRELMKTNKPPQSWYDEDHTGLY